MKNDGGNDEITFIILVFDFDLMVDFDLEDGIWFDGHVNPYVKRIQKCFVNF